MTQKIAYTEHNAGGGSERELTPGRDSAATAKSVCLQRPGRGSSRGQAAADSVRPPTSYLAFALAPAAVVAVGRAKAITASPSSKLEPGLPPKP
jgi:hypothetical protein